ncbi:hypothetical protein FJTKL_10269 [Diaporthe vaccinii]|uniref:Secreted protein n=1 Tax=Diaporthe vaccinii TaxID=105482 RepID=A0ABR4EKC0_9PEZI
MNGIVRLCSIVVLVVLVVWTRLHPVHVPYPSPPLVLPTRELLESPESPLLAFISILLLSDHQFDRVRPISSRRHLDTLISLLGVYFHHESPAYIGTLTPLPYQLSGCWRMSCTPVLRRLTSRYSHEGRMKSSLLVASG